MTQKKTGRGRPPAKNKVVKEEAQLSDFPIVETEVKLPENKVIEVNTDPIEIEEQEPISKPINRNLHSVTVNGVDRMMTKFAFNAIRKDPNIQVELPKGSPYMLDEECKGC